ncbi:MAG TPA: hypothetical protein PLN52_15340, partial [Opitutaceae bacterium]|nr:hypothetical protein [Opitutaceae bacterium]
KDGIHPNAEGHWVFAREILRHLGARDIPADSTSAAALGESFTPSSPLIDLIGKRQALLKDAWLNQTGHLRPGMKKSPPQNEVDTNALKLKGEIDQLIATLPRS